MAHDVFISYSTSDQKIVEALSHYLEERGIRCFVAYRDIPKGVVWAAAITEAIENCQVMVVVFSKNFNSSLQVDREIELCLEEKKPILTFRIQDTEFTGAKKYYLKNLNWIDAFPQPNNYFGTINNSIQKLLINTPNIIQEKSTVNIEVDKHKQNDKVIIYASLVLLLLIIIIIGLYYMYIPFVSELLILLKILFIPASLTVLYYIFIDSIKFNNIIYWLLFNVINYTIFGVFGIRTLMFNIVLPSISFICCSMLARRFSRNNRNTPNFKSIKIWLLILIMIISLIVTLEPIFSGRISGDDIVWFFTFQWL